MTLLSCRDLELSYDGKPVISGLSLEITEGSYVCIVGENGAGKSTLLRALLGLKKPDKGEINHGERFSKSLLGYLPQQTVVQKDFPASAFEVVLSGCLRGGRLRPFYNAAERRTALDNMDKLGVADLKKACYRELSGGQQQRILLARALCAAKNALFLDEPVAGLDPVVTAEFYAVIGELNSSGVTIIMVSHDVAAAVKYATHILHVKNRALFWGTVSDYLHSEVGRTFTGGDSLTGGETDA